MIFVFFSLLLISLALAKKVDRFQFLPDYLTALPVRVVIFMMAVSAALYVEMDAKKSLDDAGSGVAFTPIAGIAVDGLYRYSRNPLYTVHVFVTMPALALLFDSGWLLVASAPMFAYLSKIVIPAEEAFLEQNFGSAFTEYAASVPRWIEIPQLAL